MTLYEGLVEERKKMKYPIKKIIGDILKEAFINDDKVPSVIRLEDATYVSPEDLNCFLRKVGIKVSSIQIEHPLARKNKWKANLIINLENDSKIGFEVI